MSRSDGGETPRMSVIIPNWNGKGLLPDVLGSLAEQGFGDLEVVVVDNGSTDGSAEMLQDRFPGVRVVELDENRGFSAACNEGIRAAEGEYVALVNNDVELDSGWVGAMVETLDRTPDAGFAASRVRVLGEPEILESAGDRVGLTPRGRGYGTPDGPEFDRPAWVASASAAAAVYRREMLDEIGLLDDDFFMYFEDVDLGMRAQIAGYRCRYVPEAVAYHRRRGSTPDSSEFMVYHGLRNMLIVYLTTFPPRYALRYLPRFVAGRFWYGLGRGGLWTTLRAFGAVLARLPSLVRRRREIYATRERSLEELESILEPPGPVRLRWRGTPTTGAGEPGVRLARAGGDD